MSVSGVHVELGREIGRQPECHVTVAGAHAPFRSHFGTARNLRLNAAIAGVQAELIESAANANLSVACACLQFSIHGIRIDASIAGVEPSFAAQRFHRYAAVARPDIGSQLARNLYLYSNGTVPEHGGKRTMRDAHFQRHAVSRLPVDNLNFGRSYSPPYWCDASLDFLPVPPPDPHGTTVLVNS